uniref:Uncharacterized protein n=1 Tax=Manihot esculenta TaxID=3983 RepID=A0A2C9U4L1_MANES
MTFRNGSRRFELYYSNLSIMHISLYKLSSRATFVFFFEVMGALGHGRFKS